jgi:Flp pilus assembly protein TadB
MPSFFPIPAFVTPFLPYVGAAALAVIAFLTGGTVGRWLDKPSASRLQDFASASVAAPAAPVPMGSFSHRVRLAFIKYGIRVDGQENFYLWIARIGSGVVLFLVMLIAGLPFLTSLVGFVAGYVFINGMVSRAWNAARTDMESEIPALLSGMKSAVATAPNVTQALDETAKTLRNGGALRAWAVNAASRMHTEGLPVMAELRDEAASLSASLTISVELIGRMWTTGGKGYAQAFENAAANLRDVLHARVLARARGAGAQGTINFLMVMTFGMIVFLTRSPSMSATVHTPLVQVIYAGIFLMIVYGQNMISDMIDKAV